MRPHGNGCNYDVCVFHEEVYGRSSKALGGRSLMLLMDNDQSARSGVAQN